MSSKSNSLAIKGAGYDRAVTIDDLVREKLTSREDTSSPQVQFSYLQNGMAPLNTKPYTAPIVDERIRPTTVSTPPKYWLNPNLHENSNDNMVVIHVCDETRNINKDFCCKRDILVQHMKYFENFLAG